MKRRRFMLILLLDVAVVAGLVWYLAPRFRQGPPQPSVADEASIRVASIEPPPTKAIDPDRAPAMAPATALRAEEGEPAPGRPPLPTIAPDVIEIHGTLHGQPFWAKLLAPDAQFDNHRMLQLVYTPPDPKEIDGTVMVDCPFILLDQHGRVVAWNGRDGLSNIVRGKEGTYEVSRELHEKPEGGSDGDAALSSTTRTIHSSLAWDLRLAPVVAALAWKSDAAEARVLDFFGPRAKEKMTVAWNGAEVTLAGEKLRVEMDGQGRLTGLLTADETKVLTVVR
jgi:hypothetical protein